ncbi:glycosyl hydrolase family 43 protein [Cladophialophora carrionii]|uniref:Glycosyl hydrolase family 43 protein n=1 Tax=Cladophialophora carrionii TaxID=86049 RepID=A0A1C1CQF7_9EURO|nr:glycosyl hydrolase family 43 protein [Cladophialophora carrionii]
MVAIPTYMMASTAATSLGPLWPRNSVIRSPRPDPIPQTTSTTVISSPDSDPFASIIGPHISSNFPDPAIIYVDGMSYAFATNNRQPAPNHINIQVAVSTDNQTWTLVDQHDALPNLGAWETGAGVWAPDVVQLDDGTFVLYYADNVVWSPAHHCVGVATSQSILGPYIPQASPFACPDVDALGGAIDPDGFLDESTGKRYVVYKVDGNSIGHGGACGNTVAPIVPTPLMLQEVDHDGITPIGDAVQILDRDAFDGPLIEAPALHRSAEGVYFLFFSSNCFTTPQYDVSYATATNIYGPYTKSSRPLLVTSDADLTGPGGMDIIKGGGMIVFHGHMTVNNDPILKKEAETLAATDNTTIANVAVPLVRGMWSGKATFQGTDILLS